MLAGSFILSSIQSLTQQVLLSHRRDAFITGHPRQQLLNTMQSLPSAEGQRCAQASDEMRGDEGANAVLREPRELVLDVTGPEHTGFQIRGLPSLKN